MPHICVIGLDGGTFKIIDYLVAQGRLPNFAMFIERGSRAILKSTVPAVTPAAWSAFSTGTNPGKTGVVDFFSWLPGEQRISIVNARHVKGSRIWSAASETGNRVCVFNVPVTYPAIRINGIFISGMDAPQLDDRAVYPQEFAEELLSEIPDFCFNPDIDLSFISDNHEDPAGEFARRLHEYLQMELRTIEYLFEKEPWNLFVSVVRSTDIFQHQFMKQTEKVINGSEPVSVDDKRQAEFVFSCYEDIDAMFGRILGSIEARHGNLILMSDHGSTSLEKTVSLNKILEDAGLLTFRPQNINKSYSKSLKNRLLKMMPRDRQDQIRRLVRRIRSESWMRRHADRLMSHIDMEKTKACAIGKFGCLYINLKGRQPLGIVSGENERQAVLGEVESAMRALLDPDDGKNVVVSILRREQVYHGPELDYLPDMVIRMRDSYLGVFDNHEMDRGSAILTTENVGASNLTMEKGAHDSEGILIMYGSGIRNTDIGTAQIVDVAPTIFELMGIESLNEFDGEAITGALTTGERIISMKVPSSSGEDDLESGGYSEEDEEEIRKRLKNLGYL